MSRRNRPRRPRPAREVDADSLEHLLVGWRRTEVRRGTTWNVQPVSSAHALKEYICPGCGTTIEPGIEHVVAWRADGVLGERADLGARRHWHKHCWRIT